ncbi:MAG: RNA-binding protein [Fusobacteriales bacterium]|nr:MAG: RNA-binding protein [Fusobacteriales bacterium]
MEKLENYIKLCEKRNEVVYTSEFYSLSKINKILKSNKKLDFDFYFKGLNNEAEKNVLAISPKGNEVELKYPVSFFKISSKSKFQKLEHKHYLGSILSLGLKREILGDLIVKNDVCYGIIFKNILAFLKDNLTRINTSSVEVIEIEEKEVPRAEFENLQITLTSPRLDSFVSELTNLSRNMAITHINIGNVQINYEVCRRKDIRIKKGDILTIKKYGKYIVGEEKGFTKKSKLKIIVKKYI